MAAAKVIFLDDSFHPVYWVDFPPDVRIVQLWHAVGRVQDRRLQPVGKRRQAPFNPFGRVHKNYTHAIVSSDFDVPFYAEAFGIPEDRRRPDRHPAHGPLLRRRSPATRRWRRRARCLPADRRPTR